MTQYSHRLPFGAELQPGGQTSFRLWAPSAESIALKLPNRTEPMREEGDGWFTLTTAAPAGTRYSYMLADGLTVPDPAARTQFGGVHGPSVVVDPHAYVWKHPDWAGRPWHETVLYELHVGLMGGFKAVEARLPELAALGVTAVELMPLSDVPGTRNWGYDGVLPFAPSRTFGTPEDLKSLIDTAHGLGLMVFVDVVYNHFGPDGAYMHAYAKPFFRDDISTPWGASIDFRRPEVRDFFDNNALFWLQEYRVDGLRLDAVHAISEEGFLIDLAATVRRTVGPDRHVHLVLEHEDNRAALLRDTPDSKLYDAQWADDLHHCIHVLLTGDTEGYYQDFQDATPLLARCLAEGFAYQGEIAPHRRRPRGEPSGYLPSTAFVVCLQNHDQVGNRAMGERLTMLSDPSALRAATAFLLLCPFIPMLFMGEEWASTSPFLFFTDHHDALAEAVREGRRSEFAAFVAFQDEKRRKLIPDPNAEHTFRASEPERTDPAHADWVAALLSLRHRHVVPGLPGCRSTGSAVLAPGAVQGEWLLGTGETLTIMLNLGRETVEADPINRKVLFATPGATQARLPPASVVVQLA